jgi:prepilin-type N-terminal cleavage/methylation domain-containing protein
MPAMSRARARGLTLVELAVVVAIIGIVAAVAGYEATRARPRASFGTISVELQALVHAARQEALGSGVPVAVLVFPDFRGQGSQGRFVVVRDAALPADSLFSAGAALTFDAYTPDTLPAPTGGAVVTTLDLPAGVNVGPLTGLGVAHPAYPYDGAKTDVDCSFCSGTSPRRGAIRFDARGRVKFYDRVATTKAADTGGSISIYAPDLVNGTTFATTTLVITSPAGTLRTFHNG